jgi:glutamyl-tRNA(Gln) amidotransferase subunit E
MNGKVEIGEPSDLTPVFESTACKMIAKSIAEGKQVFGIRLAKHKGILGTEACAGRRYGTELSDYAKPAGVKGIIHSDEDMKKYSISDSELAEIRKELKMSDEDAFVLVVAERKIALDALSRVKRRAAMLNVPEETRRALPDGTSAYMRPLPGKSRMYPETDVPPVRADAKLLSEAAKYTGAGVEEKLASLEKLVGKEMAGRMLKSRNLQVFEKLVERGAGPVLAAATLEETLVSLRRAGVAVEKVGEKELSGIFEEYNAGNIVKAAIPEIITALAKAEASNPKDAISKLRLERIKGADLKKLIESEKGDVKALMAKYRLRVDGKELHSFLLKK